MTLEPFAQVPAGEEPKAREGESELALESSSPNVAQQVPLLEQEQALEMEPNVMLKAEQHV